jgi:hypothetical protein
MTTKNTASPLQGNKDAKKQIVPNVPVKKANDYKQKSAKVEVKEISQYTKNVLNVNKELKKERVKLGYCIDDLLKLANLPTQYKSILSKAKKDSVSYKLIETNVKKTKNGFNAFYLLQYLHKATKVNK